MDIDKFYRALGFGIRSLYHRFIIRPIKNFNVENRAHREIEKPKAAPWHESTRKEIEKLKKDDSFEKYNQFNPKLSDNLKTVKVNSDDGFREFSEKDSKRKLPKDRFGAEFPYTLNPVESVPRGKLSVMNVLDLLLDYRRNNKSTTEIASKYGISVEDAENIVKYVDIYQVITKTEQHDLYQLKTETTEKTEEIKSLPDFQKVIRDK